MRSIILLVVLVCLSGCSSLGTQTRPGVSSDHKSITLPMFPAWFENSEVYYITTDISDPDMARGMNANYVPRLYQAVPPYPKPPGLKTVLERVYIFSNSDQASVFASIPKPVGPESDDTQYSPLWLVHRVTWNNASEAIELRSEEAVLDAFDKGLVDIHRTNTVVNCPVVLDAKGNSLVPLPSGSSDRDNSRW